MFKTDTTKPVMILKHKNIRGEEVDLVEQDGKFFDGARELSAKEVIKLLNGYLINTKTELQRVTRERDTARAELAMPLRASVYLDEVLLISMPAESIDHAATRATQLFGDTGWSRLDVTEVETIESWRSANPTATSEEEVEHFEQKIFFDNAEPAVVATLRNMKRR